MKSRKPIKSKTKEEDANNILGDIKVHEKTQEALDLLIILSMSDKNKEYSKTKGIKETFSDIRNELSITE